MLVATQVTQAVEAMSGPAGAEQAQRWQQAPRQ
jgi:hypothetical protein